VVNVQRFSWGDVLYVNIGAAPIGRTTGGWLPESKCLVLFRAEALDGVPAEALVALSVSAFEGADPERWRAEVTDMLAEPMAAALAAVNDLPTLRYLLRERVGERVMIHREVRESLDL
jgi:hypothetical protein